jgi:tight adherence protein C
MTRALLLAVAASTLAAAGIVELAAAGVGRRRRKAGAGGFGGRRYTASRLFARLGARLGLPAAPAELARRLEAAGSPQGFDVAEVMAMKWGGAVAGGLAALPTAAVLPGRLGVAAIVAAPAAAFLAPDALLTRRIRRRRTAIAAELPDVLDLLHVAASAGLPPLRAFGEVGRRHRGVLATELRTAATHTTLGVPRAEALARLTRRCPHDGVTALVVALRRSERHGTPLGPTLEALALDARAQQAQRLRERAARAAPKIQLVVALLLVPAVLLLVGASLAAALL